jgi:hypothetical protein
VYIVQGDGAGHTVIEGVDVDVAAAEVVGQLAADPDGNVEFKGLVRETDGLDLQTFQVLSQAGDGRWLRSPILDIELLWLTPVEVLPEASPQADPDVLLPGDGFRACIPLERTERCNDLDALGDWDVLSVVGYALDQALPAGLSAQACVFETVFSEDCCYDVAVFDIYAPPDLDLCTTAFDAPSGTGTGGYDWGGGWLGRPYTVDGERRVAGVRQGPGWSVGTRPLARPLDPEVVRRAVVAWTQAGRAEHAAVASFARFTLELVALGAPSDLVERALAAGLDEVRHTRLCFEIVRALSGEAVELGPLEAGAPPASVDPDAVLVAAIREGCFEETVSAMHVAEAAARCADPDLAESLRRVADDEVRHAELSWAVVRWMVHQDPARRRLARATFAALRMPESSPDRTGAAAGRGDAVPDPLAGALGEVGILTDLDRESIGRVVLERVVRPCAAALLDDEDDRGPASVS